MPEDAPNHFVMNITPEDVDELSAMIDTVAERPRRFLPDDSRADRAGEWVGFAGLGERSGSPGGRRTAHVVRTQSDLGSGAAAGQPSGQRQLVVRGDPRALVSLEDDYAEDLGLRIGDTLVFDIAGATRER